MKGTALEKWINIIDPLCEPYPDCIKNRTVESILDLEFRDPKTERNRKRAKLPPLTAEMLEDQPKKEELYESYRRDATLSKAEKSEIRREK